VTEAPEGFVPPPPPGTGPKPRQQASRWWSIAWLTTFLAAIVGGVNLVVVDLTWPLLVANMALPWIAAASIVSVVAAFIGRQGVLILFAIPAAIAATWPVGVEIWPRDPAYGEGTPLRVLTANLYLDNIDHEGAVAAILAADADVLCLQEVTHAWARSLDEKGVTEAYPHRHIEPEDSPFGIALLSRMPMTEVEPYELAYLTQLRAILDVEGTQLELHCVHLMPPLMPALYVRHERGGADLVARLSERGEEAGPIALAGDFNSTPYNALHRALDAELDDAWDVAGDGFGHTAPATLSLIPPMRVDHVYAGGGVRILDADLLPGNGSDHHPLLVYLAVPKP